MPSQKNDALNMIAEERQRQIDEEWFTQEGDMIYVEGELAKAAACYATPPQNRHRGIPTLWPWNTLFWKPAPIGSGRKERIRELVKAGALIAAEIERLQNMKSEYHQERTKEYRDDR